MQFSELKKNLKKDFSSLKKIKLALLADSSTQLLTQALRGQGFEAGLDLDIYEADYDQIKKQVFDRSSKLYAHSPDVVVLFLSSQKLMDQFYALDNSQKSNFGMNQLTQISGMTTPLNENLPGAKVILFNFMDIDDSVFGNFSNKTAASFPYQLRKLNYELMNLAQKFKNVFICDVSLLQSRYGRDVAFDPRLYIEASMVFSLDFLPIVAKNVTDIILAFSGIFKKCLIVDLDNTLWGGVIGDDGIENIQIGELGLGKIYSELQRWIKQLKSRGILLAVCSKNNETLAREPFLKHPDMELSLDDFSIFIANWDSKVDNIKALQQQLAIGFDSLVFLDDSPFERNLVRSHLPTVQVPELPEDPAYYLPYLRSLNLFETASFIEEDSARTQQLQENIKRQSIKKSFTNESDFLKSLAMVCEIKFLDNFSLPRVAQLIQRSNQFNLRTIRYSEQEIEKISKTEGNFLLTVHLKDTYGDYGLIGALLLQEKKSELFIDTWIMSCRVLGRGVEFMVLNAILALAKKKGFKKIVGEYIPTTKNELVKDHYSKLGFQALEPNRWMLSVDNATPFTHHISYENQL